VRVHSYIDGAIRHPVKATHVLCPTPSVEFLQQLDPCVKDNSLRSNAAVLTSFAALGPSQIHQLGVRHWSHHEGGRRPRQPSHGLSSQLSRPTSIARHCGLLALLNTDLRPWICTAELTTATAAAISVKVVVLF
jgi:hypothetical protein